MKSILVFFDNLWVYLLYVLAMFPILPRGVESVLMIAFFLVSVTLYINDYKSNKRLEKKELFKIIIFSTIFILYVLGLIYSDNLNEAAKFIIRVLPLVIFPLIFGILRRDKLDQKKVNILFSIYVVSLILGLIITHMALNKLNLSTVWDYRQTFEKFTKVHGNYYSVWIGMGALIVLNKLIDAFINKNSYKLILLASVLIYFLYWQAEIGARVPMATTILVLITLAISKAKNRKTSFILLLSFLILLLTISILKPNSINRIKELAKYDSSLPDGDYHIKQGDITNTQIRNGIYYCSFKLVKKSWLVGYGIGDVNDSLQECYLNNINSNVYQVFKFNSHNQYLHFLLSSGIIGLLMFLISIIFPATIAYKTKNLLYLLFNILVLVCLLTENMLNRHDGILFYSFFNAIFAFTDRTSHT